MYRKTIDEIGVQIERLRDVKKNIEMDWSNKKEADEYDSIGARLTNGDTNKQFYAGVTRPPGGQSLPEDRAQFSHDNIARSELERMASIQLRTIIMNIINDCSSDMRTQADNVESALAARIQQLEDAKAKLKDHLVNVSSKYDAVKVRLIGILFRGKYYGVLRTNDYTVRCNAGRLPTIPS